MVADLVEQKAECWAAKSVGLMDAPSAEHLVDQKAESWAAALVASRVQLLAAMRGSRSVEWKVERTAGQSVCVLAAS
jgi:hypothetical protein